MNGKKLNVMMIGAHPDDCDTGCGGTAIKLSDAGHRVRFVSMTDGSAGHQNCSRADLANQRREEAKNAAAIAGIEYQVLDYPDGLLEVTLETRAKVLSIIRTFDPDIIITHRPNDYHPDHRYTSLLVQDASYLVMVPNVCPEVPILKHQPAIFYMSDDFQKPNPFQPDVAIDIGNVFERKLAMVSCHKSQFFDWLPWMARLLGKIPDDYDNRNYAFRCVNGSDSDIANRYRSLLIQRYGAQKGSAAVYAEAFELSEYGRFMDSDEMNRIFPH